ncbi:hypothetical protein [Pricia sp.]|uniref:hypothetical protein n=1 Tax=Pricia sp. TaxID=2268138 RepID=UPI0035945D9F
MKPDRSKFQELEKHLGIENYEIVEIIPKKNLAKYLYLDSITGKVFIKSYYSSPIKKESTSNTIKFDYLGNVEDKYDTYFMLNDGTMFNSEYYSTWVKDGNTVRHKYYDPFSKIEIEDPYEFEAKEKNPEKWLQKFEELYAEASYVYESSWWYYFKVEDKWYLIKYNLEIVNDEFVKKHPKKEDQKVRMIQLKDLSPDFSIPPEERNTDLIKEVGYDSTYEEEVDKGIFSYGFSAGWWYLEINMPFGDPIRIKRYSDFKSPNLQLYKIPAAYGGRNDVLFIIQKPEELFPEQVGGMWVIRPRDAQQPERRYKSISYGDTSKGQPHILKFEEMDDYKKWIAKKKG